MNERPQHIDLFSGVGGFALAAAWAGFRTVAFCEIDAYCQAVIKARFGAIMADAGEIRRDARRAKQSLQGIGEPCKARIFGDIRTLDGTRYRGADLLTGGFPCQPFSVAGKRGGAADDRFPWPEMLRVIDEARPAWVLGENVAGIVQMELDRVLLDLENLGYSCRPIVIPACAVDARHRRDRVWIVGHAQCAPSDIRSKGRGSRDSISQPSEAVAYASKPGSLSSAFSGIYCGKESAGARNVELERPREWLTEPDVGRVAHGVRNRVDRLKGLGNAIVPQVAFEILREIRRLI